MSTHIKPGYLLQKFWVNFTEKKSVQGGISHIGGQYAYAIGKTEEERIQLIKEMYEQNKIKLDGIESCSERCSSDDLVYIHKNRIAGFEEGTLQ